MDRSALNPRWKQCNIWKQNRAVHSLGLNPKHWAFSNLFQVSYEDDLFSDPVAPNVVEEMDIYSKSEQTGGDIRRARKKVASGEKAWHEYARASPGIFHCLKTEIYQNTIEKLYIQMWNIILRKVHIFISWKKFHGIRDYIFYILGTSLDLWHRKQFTTLVTSPFYYWPYWHTD